jgi:hypothetical protein
MRPPGFGAGLSITYDRERSCGSDGARDWCE